MLVKLSAPNQRFGNLTGREIARAATEQDRPLIGFFKVGQFDLMLL